MSISHYCVAEFQEYRTVNTPTGDEYELVDLLEHLADFNAVLEYLKGIYDKHATQMADLNAELDEPEDLSTIGGFCSLLTNRWGSTATFALGKEYCLFTKIKPEPSESYRQGGDCEDVLDFWHVGWHHTEYWVCWLAPRESCIAALKSWLDSNSFKSYGE